jgi:hypothetical protein
MFARDIVIDLSRRWMYPVLQFMLLTALASQAIYAQNAEINNITQTPRVGTPHDYLKDMSEIVNPANGQLSVRVAAPMPADRGTLDQHINAFINNSGDGTVPTALWYNSGTSISPHNNLTIETPYFEGVPLSGDTSLTPAVNTGPVSARYQPGALTQQTVSFQTAVGPGPVWVNCSYKNGYTYWDNDGVAHALGLVYIGPGSNYTACTFFYDQGIQNYLSGGDEHYKASFSGGVVSHVYDIHGNDVMNQEDPNGNFANGSGRYATLTSAGYAPVLGQYDEYGLLGWEDLTIPGLGGPYAYTSNPSLTFTPSATANTFTLLTPDDGTICGTNTTVIGNYATSYTSSINIEYLSLPNQQYYIFQWDPTYDKISQITYPTGGRVKYAWTVNPQSEAVTLYSPTQYDSRGALISSSSCSYRYNPIAVQSRIVSYDGVNDAQEQNFSYQTTWSGNSTVWTSKTTTVTTTDLLTPGHPSYKTIYTYVPGFSNNVPFSATNTLNSSPQALENTIAYYDTTGSLLQTITKTWNTNDQMSGECITLPNGKMSGTFYNYLPYNFVPGASVLYPAALTTLLVTDKAEYDYGSRAQSRSATNPFGMMLHGESLPAVEFI